MGQTDTQPQERYENLICRLPGVFSANVVLDETGSPREIHVLCSDARSPKVLARDIQSALMAAFQLTIDYRIISIAAARPALLEQPLRFRFSGVETRFGRSGGEVTVCLSHREEQYRGTAAAGSRHRASRIRAVAEAALQAVRSYDDSFVYELLFAEIVVCAGKSIALVGLLDPTGRQLVGSVLIEDDVDDAFVCAVLDALNRPISWNSGV